MKNHVENLNNWVKKDKTNIIKLICCAFFIFYAIFTLSQENIYKKTVYYATMNGCLHDGKLLMTSSDPEALFKRCNRLAKCVSKQMNTRQKIIAMEGRVTTLVDYCTIKAM